MIELRVVHTADLDADTLNAARALLDDVFVDDPLTEQDWEHCQGGLHALLWHDTELIGHAAVVQRRLLHGGRALRAGYVEGVGVRADHRQRGHGGALMAELERIIHGAYDLGALGSTDEAIDFYTGRGWQRWQGPTSALTPAGIVRTKAADDYVLVLAATQPLAVTGGLTCDWRDGEVW
jgi:aminoglycoside 2'-N-acetyltransferase I